MNYCELPQHPWPTLVAGGTGQPPCECHRASGSAGIRRLRASDAPVVPCREKRRGAFGPLDITLYMEVSINRGSPKLMGGQLTILLKWMIWGYLGVAPFSETPIWRILAAHLIAALLGGQSKAYHGGYYHYTWDEHLSDHERFWDVNLCIHIYLSIYLYLSINLSIYLSIYLYLSISIYIYLYLSISIYIYLYLSISIYIYLYLSISIYIYLYLSISIYIYLNLSKSI